MTSDFACAQRLTPEACVERYSLGGAPAMERAVELPATHVRFAATGALQVHAVASSLVRVLAKVVYLFPVLLVAKIGLWIAGSWYGDLITLVFVVCVVALFAAIALATLTHLLVGPRSTRHRKLLPRFAPPGDPGAVVGALEAAPRAAGRAGGALRVKGRVRAGLAAGQAVLGERWLSAPAAILRLVEGRAFAVVTEDERAVLVDLAGCPILVGTYSEAPPGSGVPVGLASDLGWDVATLGPAATYELREGDEVELYARESQPVEGLIDESLRAVLAATAEGGPYRAGQAEATLVRSTPSAPVVLIRRPSAVGRPQ